MRRSWLFVPGNRPDMLEKAFTRGADVVIFDLEDSVPPQAKQTARAAVAAVLAAGVPGTAYVRVNPVNSGWVRDDVAATLCDALAGYVLPKVEQPADLVRFGDLLQEVQGRLSGDKAGVRIVPLLETAAGVERAAAIATAHAAVERLALGALDLALDLGLDQLSAALADYARVRLVMASRVAGLEAPVDTVHPAYHDLDSLAAEARQARQIGFGGKLVIHPNQVAVVNQVFQPTPKELAEAQRIVQAYEQALADGLGAVEVGGRMVDRPVYERARRLLEINT
ncbi:MAG: CoA ester lyase [Alicyclobacillaceae bacterium]|nr:CoA ester lyase [Alicyclobacillaceae bacterium]